MYYNVLVKTGYVEDSDNGWLWLGFESDKKLKDREVWDQLSTIIRSIALHEFEQEGSSNHTKCGKIPKNARYCPHCGKSARKMEPGEIEAEIEEKSSQIIRDLARGDCINASFEVTEAFEEAGWDLWAEPGSGRMVFISGADRAFEDPKYLEISSKKVTFK